MHYWLVIYWLFLDFGLYPLLDGFALSYTSYRGGNGLSRILSRLLGITSYCTGKRVFVVGSRLVLATGSSISRRVFPAPVLGRGSIGTSSFSTFH